VKRLGALLVVGIVVGSAFALGVMKLAGAIHGGHRGGRIEQPSSNGQYVGSNPPGRIVAPDFQRARYRGHVVPMAAPRGKVVVLTVLDTDCHDHCPVIAAILGHAMPSLSPALRAQSEAMAVSVNPRVDNKKTIATFLAQRHATGALDFLVGSIPTLRHVWIEYHILPAVDTGNNDIHSADVLIFNRRGRWVSSLNEGLDLTVPNLVHDVAAAYADERS
jgi:cytochrome oxidase Cu insertion factor (SCO1/SenC/PrrC family)